MTMSEDQKKDIIMRHIVYTFGSSLTEAEMWAQMGTLDVIEKDGKSYLIMKNGEELDYIAEVTIKC